MNDDGQEQSQRIGDDVAFSTLDELAFIEAVPGAADMTRLDRLADGCPMLLGP